MYCREASSSAPKSYFRGTTLPPRYAFLSLASEPLEFYSTMTSSTGMASCFRVQQFAYPIIKPCCDPFTPCDFTKYEFVARTYIPSHENLVPSRYVPSLFLGFKDPLVRD